MTEVEMVDVASRVELKCGCGAEWAISGLLASSDLAGVTSSWANSGHDHSHGDQGVEVVETRPAPEKKDS